MKKLFLLMIAVVVGYTASAQRIGYGPRVGLNVSTITDKAFDTRINFNAGAFVEYDFTYSWSLELAAVYSRQGGTMKNIPISLNETKDATLRLDYINVPLVAKYYPWMGLNVFLGPQFGFLVNAKQKIETISAYNVKEAFHTFDIAAVAGVGYTFDFGLMLSANYAMSLRNNIKAKVLGDFYNGTFQFNVGWRF